MRILHDYETMRILHARSFLLSILMACGMSDSPPDAGPGDEEISQIKAPVLGIDGTLSIFNPNTVINQYTRLAANASAGATVITVNNSADLTSATFGPLGAGDLIMLYQAQGAAIDSTDTSNYGAVTALNGAGRFEFMEVVSVAGNNITVLSPGLINSYTTTGHSQVIRVPQLENLFVYSGGSIVAPAWNSATGGVVAAVVTGVFANFGTISADGIGFQGGVWANTASGTGATTYRTTTSSQGAIKGESIVGYISEYSITYGGQYARGAAANGGGGGNNHNSGGGGGANGDNGNAYSGAGVMSASVTGAAAWALDPEYIANGNARTDSSGGGRGSYSWANSNQNALVTGPGNAAWGGDLRRNVGGRGARPVANDPNVQVFFGGGGGAGESNSGGGTSGGRGGGLVYLVAANHYGTGTISANGVAAANTSGDDGAGGGGAGGTIVLRGGPVQSSLALTANGGKGGDHNNANGEGSGGGGGGGYIAVESGAPTRSATGGIAGVTTSPLFTEFPSNGATQGATGMPTATVTGTMPITLTNRAPVNTLPGGLMTRVDQSITLATGTTIVVSDPDAGSDVIRVSLTMTNGTLTLDGAAGLTFSVGDGTSDAAMTFDGTIANINAALDNAVFTPAASFQGQASIQVVTNDLGNNGGGGALSDTDTLVIAVVTADATVTTNGTIINQASGLTANLVAGSQSATVANGAIFRVGDLVLVYQTQGATIDVTDTANYGTVSAVNGTGRYEYTDVTAVSGNNVTLGCGVSATYTTAGHAQLVRVPRLNSLTINNGVNVVPVSWDGSSGGIVAAYVSGTATINGSVQANGAGFRGGPKSNNIPSYGQTLYRTTNSTLGGPKGESIVGSWIEYDALNGRYGRGAPANGGGGGNGHDTGGGGGANGNNGNSYNGAGVMSASDVGAAAWALDSDYAANGNARTNSSGGGRGGYSSSTTNQNALTTGPGNGSWGGDLRRQAGGRGGRPLTSDAASAVYLGGGGGAGDMNQGSGGSGGAGGGLVLFTVGSMTGTGALQANGASGESSTINYGWDGAGGGGGGGTIVVFGSVADTLTVQANGGDGGDQAGTSGPNDNSDGPGGAGGGGYIAIGSGAPTRTANAGIGGTTTSTAHTEFPANGATHGASGQATATAAGAATICFANLAPVNTVPSTQTTPRNQTLDLSGAAAMSIADADAGGDTVRVTLTVTNGTISLDGVAGLSFVAGDGVADALVTFEGTIANINAALDGADFIPTPGFAGTATIEIVTNDLGNNGGGGPQTDTDSFSITVTNNTPVANNDALTVNEDVGAAVNVLANDSGLGDTPLSVVASDPPHGTVVVNGDNTITYTPDADYNGADAFTYTVTDADGQQATATVNVTINAVNDVPVANNDSLSVNEDVGGSVNVLANDTGLGDAPITVSVADPPHGTAVVNGDNTISYTPDADYNGADSFTYTITDGNGSQATATISVTINAVNDVPVANNDALTVNEDGSGSVNVLANDSGLGDAPISVVASDPPHGTAVVNGDNTITYTPDADYNGTDSFTYTVTDGNGSQATATITITINAVNDVPVANNDTLTVNEDASGTVSVLGNDTGLGDTPLTLSVSDPPHGTAVVNGDNSITYTPDADYNGADSFAYTITDSNGTQSTASVSVTVSAVNDVPIAVADLATVNEDSSVAVAVLGNDTGLGDGPITVIGVTDPAHGTTTINGNGSVTYVPDPDFHGSDSFSYTISDGDGQQSTATVTMTVTSVNDTPVANADSATVPEDGSVTIAVLANDTGLGDAPLVLTTSDPPHGSVVVNGDNTLTYQPDLNYNGPDSFTYTVTDADGQQSTVTVTVAVTSGGPGAPTVTAPTNGQLTNDNTPTISGTCDTGNTVTVTEGASTVCTATCVAGTFSCTSGALASGPHTITAVQTDGLGDESPPSTGVTFTIDAIAPAVPTIVSPTNGTHTPDATPTIAGACEPGATVTIQEGAAVICSAVCTAGGTYACDPATAFGDGVHNVTASQVDSAGNTSPTSAPTTFTIDTIAPGAPTITLPANGSFTTDATPAIGGVCEAFATVTVREGLTVLCTTTCSAGGTYECAPSTPLGDGPHTITASQTDRAGHLSPTSAPVTFTIDTAAVPGPTIDTPAMNQITSNPMPTVSGTCVPGNTVTITEGANLLCTAVCDASGLYDCTVGSSLADGPHLITAVQTNLAGANSVGVNQPFVVDTLAPTAPQISGPADGSVTNDTTPPITGTCEANATVIVLEGANVLCSTVCDGAGQFLCETSTPLASGPHTITAVQQDGAGNTSPPADPVTVTIDTSASDAPSFVAPTEGMLTNDNTPAIAVTCVAGETVTIRELAEVVCTGTCDIAGMFVCDAPMRDDGIHTFTATQTDPSGNESAAATVTFTIDTAAPGAPTIDVPGAGSTIIDATPTVSGTCEPGATVVVSEGAGVLCTTLCDAAGTYACVTTPLDTGAHTISATQTDPAGNTSPSAEQSFEVAPGPGPVITEPADDTSTKDTTPTVAGTCEPTYEVTVYDGAVVLCTATCDVNGMFTCEPSVPMMLGSHVLTATQTAADGNESEPSNVVDLTIVVDPIDTDGDGVPDGLDNCPTLTNPDQLDSDENGIGDACEVGLDSDADGVLDAVDNCPTVANAEQADADGNGVGDECQLGLRGGGCQTGSATPWTLALLMLALRRRRDRGSVRRTISAGARATALIAMLVGSASAQVIDPQDFGVERFTLSSSRQGIWNVESAATGGAWAWDVHLWMGLADDPLVVYREIDDERVASLVARRIGGEVGFSLAPVSFLSLSADLPVVVSQSRDSSSAPLGTPLSSIKSAGLGDARLGAKLRLFARGSVAVAVGAQVTLGTSAGEAYRGEKKLTWQPYLALSGGQRFRWAVNAGYLGRAPKSYLNLTVDDELSLRLGLSVPLTRMVALDVAASAATNASDPWGQQNANAAEVLGGPVLALGETLRIFVGGGVGVAPGYGTPDYRVLGGARIGRDQGDDPDGDGIRGGADKCPFDAEDQDAWEDADGCPDLDNDSDGVADRQDKCPRDAEDKDGFEDENGCPDPDNDADTILDVVDTCPLEPETLDGFQDTDGCPDDRDGDGIFDSKDKCPEIAEDKDGVEDDDGCPDDNDKDGVMDDVDACPMEPGEKANRGCPDKDSDDDGIVDRLDNCPDVRGVPKHYGCQDKQLVRITDNKLEIIDSVYFKTGRDVIQKRSFKLLNNIADVIGAHPEVPFVIVEGHTDDRGNDERNLDLSQRRANAVMRYMIGRGVSPDRLLARGYGETRPIATNATNAGRSANRRVEFTIGALKSKQSGPEATDMD